MNRWLVNVRQVCYEYPDGTNALNGVSFALAPGESAALIGGNGAGKSTLLSILPGIMHPTSGGVEIRGEVMSRSNAAILRRNLGMVFQNPDDQLFMPTVEADIAFGLLNLGLPAAEAMVKVREALEQVGCVHLQNRSPHRLSVGEKRSVAIAAVLAMAPAMLVMDEPSAGLDPWSRRRLIELLGQCGQAKLIATHDLDFALDACERVLVLHQGKIVADGPAGDILRDKSLLEACRLELPLRLQGCPVCGASGFFGRR